MGEFVKAEHWLQELLQLGDDNDNLQAGVYVKAQQDPFSLTGGPLKKALYSFSSEGHPAIVECLERALEYQWVYGYPRVPPSERQLTHGVYKYMAGMQPMTAREVLRLVPESQSVMDVFCGSGTVLIEAVVAGKLRCVGCDASPLAIFVASHHCDVQDLELAEFLALVERAAAGLPGGSDDWQLLRRHLQTLQARQETEPGLCKALWFVFAVAFRVASAKPTESTDSLGSKAGDPEGRLAKAYFLSTAYKYSSQLQEFREQIPAGMPDVTFHRRDCRSLQLAEPVDAIITSPPYPGVYNYLAAALADTGAVAGQKVASHSADSEVPLDLFGDQIFDTEFDPKQELGSQTLQSQVSLEQFIETWQSQQEEWLESAYRNLRPGGTATIMTGDGDTQTENGIDCLKSTLEAAEAVGFHVVATSSIQSVADEAHRTKGMLRTEHMLHLQRPRNENT
eukprot:TRINITY_DN46128_c0_g1_i1.p1 TRINITY_DN46128_c0_g1~~TRINITY_DN46128_c0_g1_i1.p1  ORF type:complete len:452 (+),score=82.34 TRINITY_DN46128_c0_g1_i1:33-1388(+)